MLFSTIQMPTVETKRATFARDARFDEMSKFDQFMTRICRFLRLI